MKKALILLFIPLLFSCKKDRGTPCEQLVDSWRCISWVENQKEQLSSTGKLSSLVARLDPISSDGRGGFNWTAIYTTGLTEVFDGKYTVDSSCTQLRFTPTGQTSFMVDFSVSNQQLTMEGDLNGEAVQITWEPY